MFFPVKFFGPLGHILDRVEPRKAKHFHFAIYHFMLKKSVTVIPGPKDRAGPVEQEKKERRESEARQEEEAPNYRRNR